MRAVCSWARRGVDCSNQPLQDRTTLLFVLVQLDDLGFEYAGTYGRRSRTRRISTWAADRKAWSPMSTIRSLLTTLMTVL